MAIVWQNSFDGEHFLAVTPANSAGTGDPVDGVSGPVVYLSDDWVAHGTSCLRMGTSGTDGSIDIFVDPMASWSVRLYCRIPAGGWQLVNTNSTGGDRTLAQLDEDLGTFELIGQDVSAQAANLIGQPLRIEITKSGASATARVWWTDPDSTGTHDLQTTTSATGWGDLLALYISGGGYGTPPPLIDEVAIAEGEWIGPVLQPIDETGAAEGDLVLYGEADGYPSWTGTAEAELVLYGQADGRAQGLTPGEGWFELYGQADGRPGHTGPAEGLLELYGEAAGSAATGDGAEGVLVLYGEADGFAGASVATGVPVRDMWLGPVGMLHRMRRRGEWERTPDLGVEQHVSLYGTVTTSRARRAPRTTTLSWSRLERVDADALEEITLVPARSDPTIAVIDPDAAGGNLLTPEQSRGRPGPGSAPVAVEHLYRVTGPGTMTAGLVAGVRYAVVDGAASGTDITWLHPYHGARGWPVMPGWPVYMAVALADNALANAGRLWLTFHDHTGAVIASAAGLQGDGQCQADTPEGAATVSPHLIVSEDAPGLRLLGEARLSYAPLPDGSRPLGNGCPVYSVTSYSDTPALPWRSTTLALQEVRTHAYR